MRRTLLLSATAILVSVLALAEICFRFLPVSDGLVKEAVHAGSPVLKFTPNTDFVYSHGWSLERANRGRVNNDGFVNDQDYDPTDTRPLLAIVGDCFIEAAMVPSRDTVQARLAEQIRATGRVYSFGASDSALSQYLVWAEYAVGKYNATGLVINVDDDDFAESLLKYKSMPGRHHFSEAPDGRLELHRVDLTPDPLREMSRQSALGRYLHYHLNIGKHLPAMPGNVRAAHHRGSLAAFDPQRVADSEKVIVAFLNELPRRTALPADRILLVVEGIRGDLYTGQRAGEDSYFGLMRKALLKEARERGYELIDLHSHFAARYHRDKELLHFPDDRHWNSTGHATVAEAIMHSRLFSKIFPRQ